MIEKIGAVTEAVKRTLLPVIKAAVIITGVYSAGAAILILCSLFKLPIDFIWDSMACEVLFKIMFVVSMAALVLTGGIIEVWLAITGIFFILPVIFAAGVVILFPIVPVLVHRHEGIFSEEEMDETDI